MKNSLKVSLLVLTAIIFAFAVGVLMSSQTSVISIAPPEMIDYVMTDEEVKERVSAEESNRLRRAEEEFWSDELSRLEKKEATDRVFVDNGLTGISLSNVKEEKPGYEVINGSVRMFGVYPRSDMDVYVKVIEDVAYEYQKAERIFVTKTNDVGEWEAVVPTTSLISDTQEVRVYTKNINVKSYDDDQRSLGTLTINEITYNTRPTSTPEINWQGFALPVSVTAGMPEGVSKFLNRPELYSVGVVKGGEFDNYTVLMQYDYFVSGMYTSPDAGYFFLAPDNSRIVQVNNFAGFYIDMGYLNYSTELIYRPDIILGSASDIFDFPKERTLKESGYKLEFITDTGILSAEEQSKLTLVDTDTEGKNAYSHSETGVTYFGLPDGRMVKYIIKLPFMTDGVPQITWTNGEVNVSDYSFEPASGGCGIRYPEFSLQPNTSTADLESTQYAYVGSAFTGEKIYVITDPNDTRLKSLHEKFGWRGYGERRSAVTYEEFYASRPLLYFATKYGDVIELRRGDYQPLAECGKPVVYLYPEEEISASVFVDLKGPMTVSEPEHGSEGWKVTARPDGYVINEADGNLYPNLFWEGFGVEYETPQNGFVIPQEDVAAWLPQTLDKIGFTEREKLEFLEFWIPYIPNSPYVFFTFIDQSNFDRDAKLIIDPKPDSVTRVFVEFYPMLEWKEVEPIELPVIDRTGFSVVEWGGLLYR